MKAEGPQWGSSMSKSAVADMMSASERAANLAMKAEGPQWGSSMSKSAVADMVSASERAGGMYTPGLTSVGRFAVPSAPDNTARDYQRSYAAMIFDAADTDQD